MPPAAFLLRSQIQLNAVNGQIIANAVTPRAANASGQPPQSAPGNNADTPAVLAASYPPASRTEAERVLRDLLQKYREMERIVHLPDRDLSGAAAMLITGSYEAYHNTSVEPEQFVLVAKQIRSALNANGQLVSAPASEKLQAYEQMAIIGMLLSATQDQLARRPDPQLEANMKRAAAGYLRQAFGLDITRLRISGQGLSVQ